VIEPPRRSLFLSNRSLSLFNAEIYILLQSHAYTTKWGKSR
jgi:hypothetical protein